MSGETVILLLAAALFVGATPEGCARGAATCGPLPHRLESLGERGGVLCVNDSVCTTPHAAAGPKSSSPALD